jgi:hypothetical protein
VRVEITVVSVLITFDACQNHTACGVYTLRVDITFVRIEITVVSVAITFVRVKITLRMDITLCV